MSLFGSLFNQDSSNQEKVPHFEQYKKYNKLDIKKVAKRFDHYDKKKFLDTMNKEPLKTGQTIRGKQILEKMYDDHGFRFKRQVKDILTDKPDTELAERLKARNLAHTRLDRLREEDQIRLNPNEHHHVETNLTHDHAHTSALEHSSHQTADTGQTPAHHNSIPLNHGL